MLINQRLNKLSWLFVKSPSITYLTNTDSCSIFYLASASSQLHLCPFSIPQLKQWRWHVVLAFPLCLPIHFLIKIWHRFLASHTPDLDAWQWITSPFFELGFITYRQKELEDALLFSHCRNSTIQTNFTNPWTPPAIYMLSNDIIYLIYFTFLRHSRVHIVTGCAVKLICHLSQFIMLNNCGCCSRNSNINLYRYCNTVNIL